MTTVDPITSIGFAENVQIEEVSTKIGDIDDESAALEFVLTGAVEKKVHKVASGETSRDRKALWIVASRTATANPEANPERLQIGQELVLNQVVPLVTVQTTEVANT